MKVIITFDTDNAAFDIPYFDEEIKGIIKQAGDYLTGASDNPVLKDTNGNTVGEVFRSTSIR
jgi:hypothetical protein